LRFRSMTERIQLSIVPLTIAHDPALEIRPNASGELAIVKTPRPGI
jgi:hypothetical protein